MFSVNKCTKKYDLKYSFPLVSALENDQHFKEGQTKRRCRNMSSNKITRNKEIPVMVEKYQQENILPFLDQVQFMVPVRMTASTFADVIRTQMKLPPHQSFHLLLKKKQLPIKMSRHMGHLYKQFKSEDGFLSLIIVVENTFGCPPSKLTEDLDPLPEDHLEAPTTVEETAHMIAEIVSSALQTPNVQSMISEQYANEEEIPQLDLDLLKQEILNALQSLEQPLVFNASEIVLDITCKFLKDT